MKLPGCPLCDGPGGVPVVQGPKFRIVRAAEAGFPAFYRLVWADHVSEFSELDAADQRLCMDAVARVETLVRAHLEPTKVNLAALGNVVPHLHWHIVARFDWDSHFPAPVWAAPLRPAPPEQIAAVERRLPALESALAAALGSGQAPPRRSG